MPDMVTEDRALVAKLRATAKSVETHPMTFGEQAAEDLMEAAQRLETLLARRFVVAQDLAKTQAEIGRSINGLRSA